MGKAATQRKNKRMKHLAELALSDPEKFEIEWDKRISSWMELIRKNAGRITDKNNKKLPPVFTFVDEAIEILENCDEETEKKYAKDSINLLLTECCRQFAKHANRNLFRPNNYERFEDQAIYVLKPRNTNIKQKKGV